ncbi:serine/threonine-protein kinase VRK1 [Orussus abietinus]|uniref:serine/threonine-protein kinase VRK1 n=1 Tax=Orussus abietinus TaxID=222816 RepID=UPI000625A492|nr:serine/threonine-protein kinase VRK1 [Orussus abietinus]
MAGKPVKRAPKKKGANGYKLPEPIPRGEILTDMSKKQWVIGTSIGTGGFGEIYSAAPYNSKQTSEYPAVVKIEPHENGPLFVEMHFYMRNAKPADIDAWKKKRKLTTLGMPRYVGSGSHEYNNTKYRFVVMDRYGTDLWKLFLENGRRFPEHTVYRIARQIIDILQYIHERSYVHADIKGGNLLLDTKSQNQVYLVDFGLASHYTTKTEYKLDPKKAHNGTIEYTSRDAHMGVATMRGDMEILGFNMIQWLCGALPWEKDLSDPIIVQQHKEKAFKNIQAFLKECFKESPPEPVTQYMSILASMKFDDVPDYDKFRKVLSNGLQKLNKKAEGKLEFEAVKSGKEQRKVVKPVAGKNRKSPRGAKRDPSPVSSPRQVDNSQQSIVTTRRGNAEDMRQILDDYESLDASTEYELRVIRKPNRKRHSDTKDSDSDNAVGNVRPQRTRKKPKELVQRVAESKKVRNSSDEADEKEINIDSSCEELNDSVADIFSDSSDIYTPSKSRKQRAVVPKKDVKTSNRRLRTVAKK